MEEPHSSHYDDDHKLNSSEFCPKQYAMGDLKKLFVRYFGHTIPHERCVKQISMLSCGMLKALFSSKAKQIDPELMKPPKHLRWLFERSSSEARNIYHRHCRLARIRPKNGIRERDLYEVAD